MRAQIRKWVIVFKDGRKNVHHESQSGRPSFVADDSVSIADNKFCNDRRFTILNLSLEFPNSLQHL